MKKTALLLLVSTQAILSAQAVPVTSAEYLPDWSDESVPLQQVASQVNAGPVETLSQVSAAAENFVQVWDGMTDDESEDEAPVVQLAQTDDALEEMDGEVCLDVQCKLSQAYAQVSSKMSQAFGSMKQFVQTEAEILTGTVGEAETETESQSEEVNATGESETPTR